MSLETFKNFVRKNPQLITYVNNKSKTWQQFYEMYELYGDNNEIWNNYKNENRNINGEAKSEFKFKDVVNMFKNVNMDEVQKGITGIQKGITFLQGLATDKATKVATDVRNDTYEPRPMYKYFDD